jgi:hypothetical protein
MFTPHPGSRYHKVDFHIHTPQSYDYRDKTASAEDIVQAAIASGLEAIAVTDHNDYRFVNSVINAAKGTSLTVFPGVELSTRDGHLLAIFDPQKSGEDVRVCLISCELRDENQYGEPDIASNLPIERVAEIVQECGGIAIAAHVDAPKGFLKEVISGNSKKQIQAHDAIKAFEITDVSRKQEFIDGKIYPAKRACIQGSDAHSLTQIGSRPIWIRVAQLTVDGLRQAFKDPLSRIRFLDEYDSSKTHSFIESLHISQGFLGNQEIILNPGLNCIVGGQGVGKSALIEFIRFALANVSRVETNKTDHDGKLEALLRKDGTVSVVYRKLDGARYRITRTYDGNSNPTFIQKIAEDGTLSQYNLPELQRYFPVLAYSQNEAIHVARSPLSQLDLIDSHLDNSGDLTRIEDLMRKLRENKAALLHLDAHQDDIEEKAQQLSVLEKEIQHDEARIKQTQEAQNEPAIRDYQAWLDEENYLRQLREAREKLRQEVIQALDSVDIGSLDIEVPNTSLGFTHELKSVLEVSQSVLGLLDELKIKVNETFDIVKEQATEAAPNWIEAFKQHIQTYNEVTKSVQIIPIAALQNQLQKKNSRASVLRREIRELKNRQTRRKALIIERKEFLDQVEAERERISTRREIQAKRMSEILQRNVMVSIKRNGNREDYQAFLSKSLDGRSVRPPHIQKIIESYTPREFAGILQEEDVQNRLQSMDISGAAITTILSTFNSNPELLYNLEELLLEDLPGIRMRVSDGSFRTLDQLSGGQKFTVIVLLALTDDDKPIVYDQPEDALDTSLIYSTIAQQLRRSKDNRQFIFATHNPNMSVAADLDLAIVISGTANDASVQATGGIEDDNVRRSLIEYLEGGTDAIEHRVMKYDLRI